MPTGCEVVEGGLDVRRRPRDDGRCHWGRGRPAGRQAHRAASSPTSATNTTRAALPGGPASPRHTASGRLTAPERLWITQGRGQGAGDKPLGPRPGLPSRTCCGFRAYLGLPHDDQGDQGQTAPPGPGRSALPSYPAALTPKGPNPPHHHPRPPVEALLRHPGGRFSGRPMSSASARRCRPGEVAVNGGAGHTEKVGDLLHGLVTGVAQLLGEGP